MQLPGLGRDSSAISPTAHYTGHVWTRNGLSHPELATREGRLMFESLQPLMGVSRLVGGPTLEGYLVARHTALDELVRRAIEDDGVGQVIEVACGMSARGWRFASRYPSLVYLEADLPAMAARKRAALERIGSLSDRHQVCDVDALAAGGPDSLPALASSLDPDRGLVIITEGLISYLTRSDLAAMWRVFASVLGAFGGRYLSDLHLGSAGPHWYLTGFRYALSAFVRGPVNLHFTSPGAVVAALGEAGFGEVAVLRADEIAAGGSGSGSGAGAGLGSSSGSGSGSGSVRARGAGGHLSRVLEARTA
jgi:O-methyltransferase involved in polyketide biosynthesis